MLIELILLLYSWFSERDRLINRLDETLQTVVSTLDAGNPVPQLNRLLNQEATDSKYQLSGFVYLDPLNQRIAAGRSDTLQQVVSRDNPTSFDANLGLYARLFELGDSLDPTLNSPSFVWLGVEAEWINNYMGTYVIRIIAMILLISAFVTAACLVFLKPILISPLLRLDNLLVRGQKSGIQSAAADGRDLNRRDELGRVFRSFNLLRDQLVKSDLNSRQITDRFEDFASFGADCFWEIDNRFRFTYVAGDTRAIFALSPYQVQGQDLKWLGEAFESCIPDFKTVRKDLLESGSWEGKVIPVNGAADDVKSIRIFAKPLLSADGRFNGVRGTVEDISTEAMLAEELKFQATHDELTNLCNRREFASRLQHSLDNYENHNRVFTLLVLDLDQFKFINDTAGHAAGDALLVGISNKMVECVGDGDTVARLGGDEFAILLDGDLSSSIPIAETLRTAIENFVLNWDKQRFKVSVSIGLAQVSAELQSQEAITVAADSCCIEAKNFGKNQIRIYGVAGSDLYSPKSDSAWVERILKALEFNEFDLFRQFIVRVDQSVAGEHFEILLRMRDTEGGFHAPGEFLPVAERNGLMPQIDRWVVENALQWLAVQAVADDSDYLMNINLSAASLADENFRTFLRQRVARNTGLNQYLCFELTESAAMTDLQRTTDFLVSLKELGCRVALDDFGTGFSSLSHLREIPLDFIKIDGVFVQQIVSNELDQAVVKSVAEFARILRIKTVAEFVDSTEALELLEKLEIDYAQGFLFSRPEPLCSSARESKYKKVA